MQERSVDKCEEDICGDQRCENHRSRGIFIRAVPHRELVDEHCACGNHQTLHYTRGELFQIEECLAECSWWLKHAVLLERLVLINDRTCRSHDQFEEDHVHGREDVRINPSQSKRNKNSKDDRYVNADDVLNCLMQVGIDLPSHCNGINHLREVIIHEHQFRCLLRSFRSFPSHCDADVCSLQRWRIIHSVACHCHNFLVFLKRIDDPQLRLREHATED